MFRLLGALLGFILLAACLGCPKAIEDSGQANPFRTQSPADQPDEAAAPVEAGETPVASDADGGTDDEIGNLSDDDADAGTELIEEGQPAGEEPDAQAALADDSSSDEPEPEPSAGDTQTQVVDDAVQEPADGQPAAGEPETAGDAAADRPTPESVETAPPAAEATAAADGDLEAEEAPSEKPIARVSKAGVAFAGRWVVVAVKSGKRAELLDSENGWVFELDEDGTYASSQEMEENIWNQAGGWELVAGELSMTQGPGGQRTYGVEQHSTNICILRDTFDNKLLFCIRVDPKEAAVKPAKRYDSDFGAIRFAKSGPAHWRGTYGEPEGKLLVHPIGNFLVGSWDQKPGKGFVIFEHGKAGFNGVWWYEASSMFDGEWVGTIPD